jgi:acyl-CoA synthetase (AMP-forming)/AMP-acid ligase II
MVHIAGLMIGMLNPLSQGAATVVLPRFEPESYLKAIQDYRVRNTQMKSHCFSMTVSFLSILCKCKRKPKRESKMDNPETLTTLGTRNKTKTNKTKNRKL